MLVYSMIILAIENKFTDELLLRINNSQKYIYAFIYYFQTHASHCNDNATKVFNALIQAKKRNVDIKILFNNQATENKNTSTNKKICDSLCHASIDAKLSKRGRLTHAKTWIFDTTGVIIGSHNITLRSMRISREVSIYVESAQVNEKLSRYFLEQFYNS